MQFFRFPFQYNPYYYSKYHSTYNPYISNKALNINLENNNKKILSETLEDKKNNSKNNTDNYLFELFGLKLYIDDVIIISLLFFLYEEGVKDNELFISLILLLLT